LDKVATSLNKQGGHSAASLTIAEQYVKVWLRVQMVKF
jgi:hypothetical protein